MNTDLRNRWPDDAIIVIADHWCYTTNAGRQVQSCEILNNHDIFQDVPILA
jgi:hypothetical protein